MIDPILKIEDCDILICVFWKRFGTPIKKDGKTGTEHEFYKAYETWKQNEKPHIMLYFNQKEYFSRNAEEAKQQLYILEFKENLPKEGLYWNYDGIEQFKEYVYDHITKYLQVNFNKNSLQTNQWSSITSISNQEIEKILDSYRNSLEKKVSKIRLLGDNKEYDLTEVFVDFIINEEYERPSFQSLDEYKGMMDYELRKKRFLFSDYYQKGYNNENKEEKNKEKKIKPDDLLASNKKTTIIVGAPGSGKTTLMKYLVHKSLQQRKEKEYLPVYLELKKIQRKELYDEDKLEDIILSEAIISQFGINYKENEKNILKILKDRLKDGKIAFFLDGLDEIKEIDKFDNLSLRNLFNKFIESEYIRNNLVIVTTRPYALQGIFDNYHVQEMEIAPLDLRQVKLFITHYFGNDNLDTEQFLNVLSSNREIQELARVPLILGFLLQIYIKSKSLYKNKLNLLDIYDNIVTSLNSQVDNEKGIRHNFKIINPIHRRKVLTNMAFSEFLNSYNDTSNRFIFTPDKILYEVTKYCSENYNLKINIDDLFEDIKATALLREIGIDTYAFTHLTIQEYLAATVLVKDKNLVKLFCQAFFDPTICETELLPMTLGLSQTHNLNKNINLYETLEKLPESLNFANFRLCVKGLRYSSRLVDEKYFSRIARTLIEFITEKNLDEVGGYREIIFNIFSGFSEENCKYFSIKVLELLQKHLELNLPYTKNLTKNSTYILGRLRDKNAIQGLVNLLKDEHWAVRRAAAYALKGVHETKRQYLHL